MESTIRVEFAVKIEGQKDVARIDEVLKAKGLSVASANLESQTVLVELNPADNHQVGNNINALQQHIENQTGFVTVVKGVGQLGSVVAELASHPETTTNTNRPTQPPPKRPVGVFRMSQLEGGHCYVDGQVDRLSGGLFSLAVHEFGDLSGKGFESIGKPIINLREETTAEDSLLVKRMIPECDVASLIGRSIALTEHARDDDKHHLQQHHHVILSAGVIARASVVGANKKQVCTCSGKSIWQERLDVKQNKSSN